MADVLVKGVRPGGVDGMPPGGQYKVVTDITGDLGEPSDPEARKAQSVIGMIAQERPMTEGE
ncbi:hypothetical protein C6N75_04550 [Streptomyces solincola]|uniref:Uncharacterized protein n=1 Tax=Streptomyces solincola TaxID=2100817 RepID=A0A2S9Q177_9ACTN|nr:hypothetical protein C6N75_04550 [Streptomyces solincola]